MDAKLPPARRTERLWSWVVLACVLLFIAAVRFRLREMPLERDEGEFAYGGQLLLQGVWPEQLLYSMKLPGTHAVYAVWMSLFGQSCAGVHLGFAVFNCASVALLFLLARTLVGGLAACAAAATYGVVSLSQDTLGTSAHATHLVVLFALAGLLLLWRASQSGHLTTYLAAGLLLGSSVLMKHNGLLFAAFGALWLVWLGCRKQLGPNTLFWKAVASFLAGTATPLLVLLLMFWRTGTLESQWFWSVTYAGAYAKPNPGATLVWLTLMQRMPSILPLPFYAALLGLVALWTRRGSKSAALFATGFLIFSLMAVVPGLHFRPHYYVVLLPALTLLTGTLVEQTTAWLGRARWRYLAAVPALALAAFLARGIARERSFLFQMTPIEACRSLYGFQPFPEALALADYIRKRSAPDACIAVLGSEPEVYFYAQRRSATGYVYTYPLTENQPFAPQMREQMRREIEAAQPQFIVQVRSWTSWLSRPGSAKRIGDLCDALTPPHYKLIAACDFFPGESRVVWHWPPEAMLNPPSPSSELLLFERVAAAPGTAASVSAGPE